MHVDELILFIYASTMYVSYIQTLNIFSMPGILLRIRMYKFIFKS
jgi:hypothetical protein